MKRHRTGKITCLLSLCLFLTLLIFSSPAFGDLAKCGCYCGELTDPPCSDAKCKEVCRWKDGSGGNRRDRGEPIITVPDPVTERHNRALDLNRQGLIALGNSNWMKAVEQFSEALKLWPENDEIRQNLNKAETGRKAAKDKEDWAKLNEDLAGQDKRDKRMSDLDRDLKNQDRKDRISSLDRDMAIYDRKEAIKKHEAKVTHLREMMKVDQQAIRTVGLYDPRDPEKRARDFEGWAQLAEETQLEHEKEFLDDILAVVEGLAAASVIDSAKKVTLKDVKNLTKNLRSLGITEPYFLEAIDAASKGVRNKAALKRLVSKLHAVVAGVELTITPKPGAGPEERSNSGTGFEQMDGLAEVLTVIDPKFKVLAAEFRFLTSALYDNAVQRVSRRSVQSLTRLTESQLVLVTEYNKRMKVCADEIAKEKETLRRLSNVR